MKFLFQALVFICLSSLFSCDKGCKENYTYYGNYSLTFFVLDKETEQNLLETGVHRYFSDTVEIYNESLEPLGLHPDLGGSFTFGFLTRTRDPEESLNIPIEHTYYVYFEEGDYDTLTIAYQIGLDECHDKILKQGSVSYNDSLYI